MIEGQGWLIERRIPMALLVTLCVQIATALIWATQLDARVSHVEQQGMGAVTMGEKFARLEERLDFLKQNITTMRQQLDRIAQKDTSDARF